MRVQLVWGPAPIMLSAPEALAGPVELCPGCSIPSYRLLIIGVGLAAGAAAVSARHEDAHRHAGARRRATARWRRSWACDVDRLFTAVFGSGAALCAVAGALLGPLLAVQVGMGENILILAFVVIVIGGIGSIRGALVGALLVGIVDTAGPRLPADVLRDRPAKPWPRSWGRRSPRSRSTS